MTIRSKRTKFHYKRDYLLWFLVLVLPLLFMNVAALSGNLLMTQNLALGVLIIGKLALIVVTTHYAIRLNIKDIWAIILGLSTVLPVMPWLVLIFLLTR